VAARQAITPDVAVSKPTTSSLGVGVDDERVNLTPAVEREEHPRTGRLDVAERGVERPIERVDHRRHRRTPLPPAQPLREQRIQDSYATASAREVTLVGQAIAGIMERLPGETMLFGERSAGGRQSVGDAG
jgi:hypothetical protein